MGQFAKVGRQRRPRGEPERVNVDDFMDKQLGEAIPRGVYDIDADAGWSAWAPTTTPPNSPWPPSQRGATAGSAAYPAASRLLITAAGGGYRTRLWNGRADSPRRTDRARRHGVPPSAGHQQMDQDRAPAVLRISMTGVDGPDQPRVDLNTVTANHPDRAHRGRRTQHCSYPKGIKIPDRDMKTV